MRRIPIAITTGDVDGIGLEITTKSLSSMGPKKNFTFFVFRSPKAKFKIPNRFKFATVKSLHSGLKINWSEYDLVDVSASGSPAKWFYDVAMACRNKKFSAVVTGPLSKTEIFRAGYQLIGHTEILQKVTRKKNLFMGFMGKEMALVLVTGHVPVTQLKISQTRLGSAIKEAEKMRKLLPRSRADKPIAVLSFNPHAGENGLIGNVDKKVFFPAIKSLRKTINVEGPLVADAFFARRLWKNYSVIVSSYHDQGLIPFKMLHGSQSPGVHLTLGMPFVRTSVDHGTAKDIFGKNHADHKSMLTAIKFAMSMARGKV